MIDSITNSVDINLSKLWEIVEDRESWYACKELDTTYRLNSNIEEFTYFFLVLVVQLPIWLHILLLNT